MEKVNQAAWWAEALARHGGNQSALARELGCCVATVRRRAREFGLEVSKPGRPWAVLPAQQEIAPKPPKIVLDQLYKAPGRHWSSASRNVAYSPISAWQGMVPGEYPQKVTAEISASTGVWEKLESEISDLDARLVERLAETCKPMPYGWVTRAKILRRSAGVFKLEVTQWKRRDTGELKDC